jgi:hypothetical protein
MKSAEEIAKGLASEQLTPVSWKRIAQALTAYADERYQVQAANLGYAAPTTNLTISQKDLGPVKRSQLRQEQELEKLISSLDQLKLSARAVKKSYSFQQKCRLTKSGVDISRLFQTLKSLSLVSFISATSLRQRLKELRRL